MASVTIVFLSAFLCYASAVKYFGHPQTKCVKEQDMKNILHEACELEKYGNKKDLINVYMKDATFTYQDFPPLPIVENFDMMLGIHDAYKKFYQIKSCKDFVGEYTLHGCEHKANPSFIKGKISIKGKDAMHSLEGSYYQEIVYEDGTAKLFNIKMSTTMKEGVFKELLKLINNKHSLKGDNTLPSTTEIPADEENTVPSEQSEDEVENIETTEASKSTTEVAIEPQEEEVEEE